MADWMQQARELLAAEYVAIGISEPQIGLPAFDVHIAAIRAIAAALSAAPEGYVLGPVQTLESIRDSSTDPNARGFAAGSLATRPPTGARP